MKTNYINSKNFRWEHYQSQEILRVCVNAYREVDDIRFLVQRTKGFIDTDFPWVKISAKEAWKNILLKGSEDGLLSALIETMLSDSRISNHHAEIQHLLELPSAETIENIKDAYAPQLPEALSYLLKNIQIDSLDSNTSLDMLRAARAYQPSTLISYRVHRVAYLLQPRFAVDKRFVRLTLAYNQKDLIMPWEFDDLQDVLVSLPDNPVLILLGAPGSGKSTLLRRLERDLHEQALQKIEIDDNSMPLPIYFSLNRFPPIDDIKNISLPVVKEWLEAEWRISYPKMPTLQDLMDTYPVILLLDGLNEMPYKNRSEQILMIKKWREMAFSVNASKHRLLFSCRNLDYTGSLSTPELPVPQVQVQPLTISKIFSFLQSYMPKSANHIWEQIKDSLGLLSTLSTPFFLSLFVDQVTEKDEIPDGRSSLISGFIRKALQREVQNENWPFRPEELFTQQECDSILRSKNLHSHIIPGGDRIIQRLSGLAYAMQDGHQRSDGGQVRIDLNDAKQILGDDTDLILRAGVALGVIDEEFESMELLNYQETVAFKHQLFQEYFIARKLAEMDVNLIAALVDVYWRADNVQESLDETISTLSIGEPLPPLPQTGWEECVILSSAMVSQPNNLLEYLIEVNLPLAARCATQSEVKVSSDMKTKIQQLLVNRSQNTDADLRHRIAVGLALGNLGDPRFAIHQGEYGTYYLPHLLSIPSGVYKIGSEEKEADKDEWGGPFVTLNEFQIGRFQVTNAEWSLFMKAGGYEDERWWATDAAKIWWRGESTAIETRNRMREEKIWLDVNFDNLSEIGDMSTEIVEICKSIAVMDKIQFENAIEEKFPSTRFRQPRHWSNRAFNNPSQPIVGICLHEAQAYCAWLSAQTGKTFRIPTEFEWEAAARGFVGRIYAHGNEYNPLYFNVLDTHVGHTTPVGIFPDGSTPEGMLDMIGNCWEWTTSTYKPYSKWNDAQTAAISKIVRRGSWYGGARNIRASSRYWNSPNRRNDYLGFRLVCSVLP